MNEEKLRDWVKTTMLVPFEMKQQLFALPWTDDIYSQVLGLYNNYATKEQNLATELYGKSTSIIIDYIREIELEDKTIEQETLIKLYQYIKALRKDI